MTAHFSSRSVSRDSPARASSPRGPLATTCSVFGARARRRAGGDLRRADDARRHGQHESACHITRHSSVELASHPRRRTRRPRRDGQHERRDRWCCSPPRRRRRGDMRHLRRNAELAALDALLLDCLPAEAVPPHIRRDTPRRAAKALRAMTSGYDVTLSEASGAALFAVREPAANPHKTPEPPPLPCGGLVVVRDIRVHSLCEHHLPFFGRAHIGYLPGGAVLGLSKLARVADMFARRLQMQERLTHQICEGINEAAEARGVAVVLECSHMCMCGRGVRQPEASTTTSAAVGALCEPCWSTESSTATSRGPPAACSCRVLRCRRQSRHRFEVNLFLIRMPQNCGERSHSRLDGRSGRPTRSSAAPRAPARSATPPPRAACPPAAPRRRRARSRRRRAQIPRGRRAAPSSRPERASRGRRRSTAPPRARRARRPARRRRLGRSARARAAGAAHSRPRRSVTSGTARPSSAFGLRTTSSTASTAARPSPGAGSSSSSRQIAVLRLSSRPALAVLADERAPLRDRRVV